MKLRKRILFITAILFSSCQTLEKNEIKTEIKSFETTLNGKVKYFKHSEYNAKEKFGEIQKDGKEINSTNIKFNEKGVEEEANLFDSESSRDIKFLLKYDEKGNNIETTIYNQTGDLLGKLLMEYDDDRNIIEEKGFVDFYDYGLTLTSRIELKYDKYGNEVMRSSYADEKLTEKITYKYDDKNNKIEENVFNSDGSLKEKKELSYNEKNLCSLFKSYDSNKKLEQKVSFSYDDFDN